ncbi:hypothetical protein ETP66_07740 [Thermus thermamylovorans]|uniref:Lipoprotein n=1 Tax=Thermus thermamylovorans TaxID=2509362 RepID=A0A4Q9B482_9DEIN|nr:hypothetical protein ETP66_07740 [Thermus thermamylovorans]
MTRIFPVGVGLLFLAACGLIPGFGGPKVTGGFQGDWQEVASGLRLALVGLTSEGQLDYSNPLEIKDPSLLRGYWMELPPVAAEGSYQVVAYRDEDNNGRFSGGDTVLGDTCSRYLLYANGSGDKLYWVGTLRLLRVRHGWNGYDAAQEGEPYQAALYTGFDLYRQGQCP